MADPRWRIEFSKITIESVQNARPWVFGVTDYEFIDIFTKMNMADLRWWMTFWKITVKSDQIALRAVTQYYSKDKYIGSYVAVHTTEISL